MRRKATKSRTGLAVAIALLTILALGAASYAAAPLWEKIFGFKSRQVEQYQALPEDEKLRQAIQEIESSKRSHQVNESAVFDGHLITMRELYTSAETDRDELYLTITYEDIPPFDPNYVDFILTMDAKEVPMMVNEDLAAYRARGRHQSSRSDWVELEHDWESGSNTFLYEGDPLTTNVSFPIDDWQLDTKTPMALSATIDGKPLRIPFAFDPEKSHEEAVEEARTTVDWLKESMGGNQAQIEALMARAVQVGITKEIGGYRCALSELAYIKKTNQLYYTIALSGVTQERSFEVPWYRESLRVDGIPTPWVGQIASDTDEINEGTMTSIRGQTLWLHPAQLPKESLIVMNMRHNEIGDMTFILRYHWATNQVTLPKDEAEEASRMREEERLQKGVHYEEPTGDGHVLVQDLRAMGLTQTQEGLTMTLEAVQIGSTVMHVFIKCNREFYGWGEDRGSAFPIQYADWQVPAQIWDSDGIMLFMPVDPKQLPNEIPISFAYPVRIQSEEGSAIVEQTFRFSFNVEQDKMELKDQGWHREASIP